MTSPPPAAAIFKRAEQVWHSQRLPPYIEFTSHLTGFSEPARIVIRTRDGAAFAQTIPQPSDPSMRPMSFPGIHLTGPDGAPLGFCIIEARCSGVLAPDPFSNLPNIATGLKTIAAVRTYLDPYVITLAGTVQYAGTPVYDLQLTPRYDPQRFQLREMLVETATYRIRELVYDVPLPYAVNDATIAYDFGPVGPAWYLQYVCVAAGVHVTGGLESCAPQSTALWNFAFPPTVPGSYFRPR